jgi:hypothetical protein
MSHEHEEALYGDNMDQVEDMSGDNVPADRWYHIRVSKVVTHDSQGNQKVSQTSGEPMCQINLAVQDEPFVGKNITQFVSLQPHALAGLKAMYKAAGYTPGPGGHNPHKLLNTEFYVKPASEVYEGSARLKIAPWHIKPLAEGRPLK